MTDAVSSSFNNEAENHTTNPKKNRTPSPAPFSIRFSKPQRKILERDANGKPLGVYVRSLIFEDDGSLRSRKSRPVNDAKSLGRVLGMLGQSRISNNLNQLAKAANAGALPVTPEMCRELTQACADIKQMRGLLIKALGLRK